MMGLNAEGRWLQKAGRGNGAARAWRGGGTAMISRGAMARLEALELREEAADRVGCRCFNRLCTACAGRDTI